MHELALNMHAIYFDLFTSLLINEPLACHYELFLLVIYICSYMLLANLVHVYTSHVSMIPRGDEVAHKSGASQNRSTRAAGSVYCLHVDIIFSR